MKKIFIISSFAAVSVLLAYCCGPKQTAATPAAAKVVVPKSTYESNVSAVVLASCSPCHVPSKGGNKRPYDNFANVKADIDEIIRRVEMEPGTRGFMPMKGQKLSAETIAVFKKWKADGLLEK
jgi:mono/diheme cytochrome c family protein